MERYPSDGGEAVAIEKEMRLCRSRYALVALIISCILMTVNIGIIVAPLLCFGLVRRSKKALIFPLTSIVTVTVTLVGTMIFLFLSINGNAGAQGLSAVWIPFVVIGFVLADAIAIGAIVFMGVSIKSVGPAVAGVLQEVDDGEGREARDACAKRLRAAAKAKDAAAFSAELNAAHARYLARKDVILSKRQMNDLGELCVAVKGKAGGEAFKNHLMALYEKRQFELIQEHTYQLRREYEERRYKVIANEGYRPYTVEYEGRSTFDGSIWQRLGWNFLCRLVMLISLGLAYPATVCWKMRWRMKHTVYCGKRLSFDGKGGQLFGKWICWTLLTIITIGIYSFWLRKKMEQWKAKHTHVAGEYAVFGGTFDGGAFAMFGVKLLVGFVSLITLGLAYPAMACWKERWYCKHRIYDGKRLSFDGRGIQLFGKYLCWILLTIVTVGIYGLFLPNRMLKWKASHTAISDYLAFLP